MDQRTTGAGPFQLLRPRCAAIDLGSRAHYVAATGEPGEEGSPLEVRRFGPFTRDLLELGAWLKGRGIKDVAMESTGVYWMPVYEALASMGFSVALVDARAAKALPGRKSDVQDCQWLCRLHMHGLVRPCHVPDADALSLRSYWRQRQRLVEQRSEQVLLMQKALEQMNVQLHKVLSDVAGASGLSILRAVAAGERDPSRLADLAHPRLKGKRGEIEKALEGAWAEHHLFALAQALEAYDFFGRGIAECDARIDARTAELCGGKEGSPPPSRPRKNQPGFDLRSRLVEMLGVDPTTIDGLQASTAMTLVAELGRDLAAFGSGARFVSYLGLCPRNKVTGGRVKGSSTAKVASRAATAFRLAAQSLHRSDAALGAYYRRMRARVGPRKAITATARKIALAYYRLVKERTAYRDEGAAAYEARFREQKARWLKKQAAKLGLELTETHPVATFS